MARKYNNFRVGGSPQKVTDDYAVWTNDLLGKVIASKTVIQPGKSTLGHQLVNSDVVYVIVNGRGIKKDIKKAHKYYRKLNTLNNDKLLEELAVR